MDEATYQVMYEREDGHWWFKGRRAVIEALLSHRAGNQPQQILDVGCGTGRNLEMYRAIGRVEGLDPSSAAVEYCNRRGLPKVRLGDR